MSEAAALVAEIAREGLAELHTHLGGSVDPAVMWTLAHEQGIALPVKDYWDFVELVTIDPRGVDGLPELDGIYRWTELIQSSPFAVERSVHGAIGGAYRAQNITTLELRFNPMKRNRGGERDLDHIIMAATRGLDLARLEYPQVRAGLILMMDRTFTREQNEVIVEKATRYAGRGIVGVDIAGPRPDGGRYPYRELAPLLETAREAGLGVTIHVGEEGGRQGIQEIGEVVESLRPERIGHGILAAQDEGTMQLLREAGTVLEICPTSNLLTGALAGEDALRETLRTFLDRGVAFTIATDGPEMMRTHLRDELELLVRLGVLGEDSARTVNGRGHQSTFVAGERGERIGATGRDRV
jgi:adenosine deaminase